MKNLSLRQQAASSTSISKQMPDTQSDAKAKPGKRRFKGKIVKAVSDAVKLAQEMGSTMAESSVLKKPLKQYRAAGEQGLKLFANKSYLDPEAADDIYKKKITDFRRAYEKALNVYVQQKDPKYFSFLKGYLEGNPKAFVFELQESPDGTTSVTVTKMRKTFTGFAEEIACLLKGHGSGGNLAKALTDSLEPLGLSLSSAIITSTWSVHMKVPEVDDSQVQPETADDTDSLPSVSPFQRSDSEEQLRLKELEEKRIKEEKLRKEMASNIETLRKENKLAFDKCTISRDVADVIFHFDPCWQVPRKLPDYEDFQAQVAGPVENLEKLSLEMLKAEQKALLYKNNKLREFIISLWESFPSTLDERERSLVRFKDQYSAKEVLSEAAVILDQPALQSCSSGGLIKSRMFSSRYAQEQSWRELILDNLGKLKTLDAKLKGFESLAQATESPWFMNLVGECLRKDMPEPIFKLGKIKISSDFRKTWKEKLEEWGIQRVDKPTRALRKQSASGQSAE